LSRQQHDLIVLIIQLALGVALLFVGGTVAWNAVGPIIKQQLNKPAP
jgi:divalent metal cation (Fe/Co/Zn/Cd) transporter